MSDSDLAQRAKAMRRLRDDAKEREMTDLALAYGTQAMELSHERLQLMAQRIMGPLCRPPKP